MSVPAATSNTGANRILTSPVASPASIVIPIRTGGTWFATARLAEALLVQNPELPSHFGEYSDFSCC